MADVDAAPPPSPARLTLPALPPKPPSGDPLDALVQPTLRSLVAAGAAPGGVFAAAVALKTELGALAEVVQARLGAEGVALLDEAARSALCRHAPGGLAADVLLLVGGDAPARRAAAERLAMRRPWRPRPGRRATILDVACDLALRLRARAEGRTPEDVATQLTAEALQMAAEDFAERLPPPAQFLRPRPPRFPLPSLLWRDLAAEAEALAKGALAVEPAPPGWERLAAGLLAPAPASRRGRPARLTPAEKQAALAAVVHRAVRDGVPAEALTLDLAAELLDEACAKGTITVGGRRLALPPPLTDHALDQEDNRRRRRERLRQWLADIGLPRWTEALPALLAPAR